MDGKGLALSVQINHNLDEVENQLDRIIAKAERVNQLLDRTQAAKQEAFLDQTVHVVVSSQGIAQEVMKHLSQNLKTMAAKGGY